MSGAEWAETGQDVLGGVDVTAGECDVVVLTFTFWTFCVRVYLLLKTCIFIVLFFNLLDLV